MQFCSFVNKAKIIKRAAVQINTKMNVSVNKETGKKVIREGKAEIYLSATDKVFYNPVQEFNRDLSIAVLSVFANDYAAEQIAKAQIRAEKREREGLEIKQNRFRQDDTAENFVTILEPLSATGLRAIRYAKEIPNVTKIVANDIARSAVEVIRENILSNRVSERVDANHDDACMVMYKHKDKSNRFAAIDLDPYGCPSNFLDAAVQAVQDGGMLLVTATDMAVLAGNSPEACHAKYGAISLKTKACHEMALRILLQCIESNANRHGRYIVPVLSISADFYIRVFVKLYSGHEQVKKSISKISMVYQCTGCGTMTLQALGGLKPNPTKKRPNQIRSFIPTGLPVGTHCEHCNSRHRLGGPIWSAPIHDNDFVSRVLSHVWTYPDTFGTAKRIEGVLSMVKEELDVPLYYTMEQLVGTAHIETMKMNLLRSAIMNAGFQVSYSHAWKNSIKTDAPARFVWDIIRSWATTHPVKPERLCSDPVAKHVLSQDIQNEINWTSHIGANPVSRRDHCLRFQINPAPYWGPGTKSAVNFGGNNHEKQMKKQNRRLKRKRSPASVEEARKKCNEGYASDGDTMSDGDIMSDGDTALDGNTVPDSDTGTVPDGIVSGGNQQK